MKFAKSRLTLLFFIFFLNSYAQHGKYKEDGMRGERPLTMFPHDKTTMNQREWLEGTSSNPDEGLLDIIRNKVANPSDPDHYNELYTNIFNTAISEDIRCNCTETKEGVAPGSHVAKAAAFIFITGYYNTPLN